MKKIKSSFRGAVCGFLNGFFGSGGGVAAVPMIEGEGCGEKAAHATSVALIFMLSLATAALYGLSGDLDAPTAMKFIPGGVAGALCGAFFLKKISSDLLKTIFGGVIVTAALRILFL